MYLCIVYIMNSLLYTWYLHICVCHTIPSVSNIECCVLLIVTSDFRQRSPAAALRQQQKLCGCPFSLRKPNMILEFPCVFRYSMWSACEGFPSSWVWIWCEISSLEVWFWIYFPCEMAKRCRLPPLWGYDNLHDLQQMLGWTDRLFFRCHSQCLWHLSPHIYIYTYIYIYIYTYIYTYLCFEWYLCSLLVHDKDQTHDHKCTSELWFVGTCWMLKHVETFTGHQTDSSSPEAVLWHRWLKAAPQRALHCGSITTQRTQQINWSNMPQTCVLVLCRCFIIFFFMERIWMNQPKNMMFHQPKNIRLALKRWPGCDKKNMLHLMEKKRVLRLLKLQLPPDVEAENPEGTVIIATWRSRDLSWVETVERNRMDLCW